MRSSDAHLVREIVRQEILKERDYRVSENNQNQMVRANNVRYFTREKDDGDGYKIGSYSNNRRAG